MNSKAMLALGTIYFVILLAASNLAVAQTPSPTLLVVQKDDFQLAIIDPVSKKILKNIPCGDDPHEVEVSTDGKLAFVSNFAPFVVDEKPGRTITIIDLVAQKQLRQLDLGPQSMPHGLWFADGKLYFTAQGFKLIGRFDPAIDKVDWMLGTAQEGTHMIALTKDLSTIFTANSSSNSVSVFQHKQKLPSWEETVIPVGSRPQAMDISPDSKEYWTAQGGDGKVSVINIASKKVVQTIDVKTKGSNRLKFTLDGKLVLISDMRGGETVVVDAAQRKEIKRIPTGNFSEGILMNPDGRHAYVAVAGENNIAIIDLNTLQISDRIPTGRNPDGLAWAVRR